MGKFDLKEAIYAIVCGCLGGIVVYFFILMFFIALE